MLAADFGVGQVLWSMLYFFFLFAFIWILITILMDLFRDHSLSGWAKAGWVVLLIFLPLLGALIYLIARGGGMQERAMKQAEAQQKRMNEYIRQTAASSGGGGAAEQIAQAHKLLESGAISQAEFDALKAKALA
ncbi:MAG TPA: SHOCT domain-containing protein [Acidimicrobiales bacterium]|nr:SHOCT domain-containing protein [Acidimicrobiales bacterium]